MSRDKNAVYYMPSYMREFKEMSELYNGLQPQFDLLYNKLDSCLAECFVLSCVGFGLERYEKMLGIKPNAADTTEDRRLRVLAALNGDTPYTFERILQKLKLLCGENNVAMDYAREVYTLRVFLQLPAKNQLGTVKKMLKKMLPCNISLKCLLAYNRYKDIKPFTHAYLRTFTQKGLREEVLNE